MQPPPAALGEEGEGEKDEGRAKYRHHFMYNESLARKRTKSNLLGLGL
jgi:hypothetical protein